MLLSHEQLRGLLVETKSSYWIEDPTTVGSGNLVCQFSPFKYNNHWKVDYGGTEFESISFKCYSQLSLYCHILVNEN